MLGGGIQELSHSDRELFAIFLMLLYGRLPTLLKEQQQHVENQLHQRLRDHPRTDGNPKIGDAPREESGSPNDSAAGLGRDLALLSMIEAVAKSPYTQELFALEWRVLKFEDSHLELVIGDHPLGLWGFNGRFDLAMIPISPRLLLVAGSNARHKQYSAADSELLGFLAKHTIDDQFGRAERFVVSAKLVPDAALLRVAEQHLRTVRAQQPAHPNQIDLT